MKIRNRSFYCSKKDKNTEAYLFVDEIASIVKA